MLDILFGWRKASKCKKLINRVQCRLKLLKNKRNSIVRQLREDVAQLIKGGYEHIAFNRVEQLIKDESIAAVYELLDHFCEFILIHLSYIRRHKDCPNDINEAVSSLIFASARCGDLPELQVIRKLFGERYGQRFALSAVELFPGNLVNREIKEKLSIQSVSEDVKHRLVDDIASECCLKSEVLALEYYPEWQKQQVKANSGHQILDTDVLTYYDTNKGSEIQASNASEIERYVTHLDSLSTSKNISNERCSSPSHQDSGTSSALTVSSNVQSTSSSVVQQSSPDVVESPLHEKAEKVEHSSLDSPKKCIISGLDHKEMRTPTASSTENLPQFSEEAVVYFDDIEEFQSFTKKDGNFQDQRVFKFKSSVAPRCEKKGISCDQNNVDNCESLSEESGSRRCRKGGKASGKRLRTSMSKEKQSMNNIECVTYYDKPCKTSPTNHPSKHQKKTPGVGKQQSYDARKGLKKPYCFVDLSSSLQTCNCRHDLKGSFFNHEMPENSLRHRFDVCSCGDKGTDNLEVLPGKLKREITFPNHGPKREHVFHEGCHHHRFWNGESNKDIEWTIIPQKPRRTSNCSGASVHNDFTCPDFQHNWQNSEDTVSCQTMDSCFTKKETLPSYSRAETMPSELPKEASKENMQRSNSCPYKHPNHVHPKLPDYDAIAAKFMSLKKEHLQKKGCGMPTTAMISYNVEHKAV
ncbi:hypothetical protein I3842_Q124300 [Carya illinoinensis]|uniref:IST1-like protein n=1 Tax=Carya illinoinensis TaxID=32201 RepID=A0A922D296_CARIL|nr:hypothetical protein I3842_Q124300 [Carya illinoinensis]